MPREKNKQLTVEALRHAEYYDMQGVFDDLYAKSKNGETFTNLMDLILSRENILLAYRNIKTNSGSNTRGTDKLTIKDIGCLTPDEVVEKVRFIVQGSKHGYRTKPVRRVEIPKPNGSTRPLGIPCIWDRLIQQCIKQIMEPICEAKFSDNSYGFRPNRSVEHAISRVYQLTQQRIQLHYVVEFDIKGFFDNVNHSKLIKQIWALGIHDKQLIYVLKQILKTDIKLPDGTIIHPTKGTPQGGIISPLLANIVLNELDHWIESQWQENPVCYKWKPTVNKNGSLNKLGYRLMKSTNLKEMYIVRYADDFRIFCRTKNQAEKVKYAVTQWLAERLKLEVSQEKTRVVNLKQKYSEFLGFKIKVHKKANKYVVSSHMSDKALKEEKHKLVKQAKRIAKPRNGLIDGEIRLYNSMVLGVHNYYGIATNISLDCRGLNRAVMTVLTNRLNTEKGTRLNKTGGTLTKTEQRLYGKSAQIRYIAGSSIPVYPIGYVKHKNPIAKRKAINCYTPEGRIGLHDNLRINTHLMSQLMRQPLYGKTTEFADNRISLFSAQFGKCAITGKSFRTTDEIHCHHKEPKALGGTDKYENLILVLEPVHKIIHATKIETIDYYRKVLNLSADEIEEINKLRILVGNKPII